jgi:hypothetical protein
MTRSRKVSEPDMTMLALAKLELDNLLRARESVIVTLHDIEIWVRAVQERIQLYEAQQPAASHNDIRLRTEEQTT